MKGRILGSVLMALVSCHAWADEIFIAMTPTEFSEGFNRAAQIYHLKVRMPLWAARNGKFSASVSPGITVSAVGVQRGDGVDKIRVQCKTDDRCHDAIIASAFSADPQINHNALATFINRRLSDELPKEAVMTQADLVYAVMVDKSKKTIDFTITVAPDED
jgi:hypothetical protein